MIKVSSLAKLKAMHEQLGGNKNGFYLTRFGHDIKTDKAITSISDIAYHIKPSANWSTKLCRGKVSK